MKKEMKYLGWANGWTEEPKEVTESKKKGHKIEYVTTGKCEEKAVCQEGGWFYMIDSSD